MHSSSIPADTSGIDFLRAHPVRQGLDLPSSESERRCWRIILLMLIAWTALAQAARWIVPIENSGSVDETLVLLKFAAQNGALFVILGLSLCIFRVVSKSDGESAFKYLWRVSVAKRMVVLGNTLRLIISFASFAAFMVAYMAIKTRIPEIMPFSWDERFAQWDRLLFLGHDPWTLFAWTYEIPALVAAGDFLYDFWACILAGTWVAAFLTKGEPKNRYRFCIALLLVWFFGGNIMAGFLSSAGPVYFSAVSMLADPYIAQMSALTAIDAEYPLRALKYQQSLWSIHEGGVSGIGGISAMPSMHCATAFLVALWVWPHRLLRTAALLFFTLIFCLSFILAWHYALDGIIGAFVALAGWWVAGVMLGSGEDNIPQPSSA